MLAAVIPARNEAGYLGKVLNTLLQLSLGRLVVVANGCNDATLVEAFVKETTVLSFSQSLGLDVPRAIGAKYCLEQLNVDGILFVDGDMVGLKPDMLKPLIIGMKEGLDLALTDCYPYHEGFPPLATKVLYYRKKVNEALNRPDLGVASPSHGPHAFSRKLLEKISLADLATPPVALSKAVMMGFKVGTATTIAHNTLGSRTRGTLHGEKMAATLIGDCLEAICVAKGESRSRKKEGLNYAGYDPCRRRDLLQAIFSGRIPLPVVASRE